MIYINYSVTYRPADAGATGLLVLENIYLMWALHERGYHTGIGHW